MMTRKKTIALSICLAALVLLIGALALLRYTPAPERIVNWAANRYLGEPLGARISVGAVGGDLLRTLILEDVEVQLADGLGTRLGGLHLRYEWRRLIRGRWHLREVLFQEPVVILPASEKAGPDQDEAEPAVAGVEPPIWPAFQVDRIIVSGGRLERPQGIAVDSLDLELSARAQDRQLALEIITSRFLLPQQGLHLRSAAASLTLNGNRLEITGLRAETPFSNVDLSGCIALAPTFSCSLQVRCDSLSLDEISSAIQGAEALHGRVSLSAQALGDTSGWRGAVRIGGRIHGIEIVDLSTNLSWRKEMLELDHIALQAQGARLRGRGHLMAGGQAPLFEADLALDDVDLSAVTPRAPSSRLNGRLLVAGSGRSTETLDVTAELDLSDGAVVGRSFDGIWGRVHFAGGRVSIDQGVEVQLPGAHLFLTGSLDEDRNLRAWADVDVANVGRLLNREQMSGSMQARFQAQGPIGDPLVAGQLRIQDLVYGPTEIRRIRGNFGLRGARSLEEGFFSLRLFDALAANQPIDEGLVKGRFLARTILLDSAAVMTPQGQVAAAGQMELLEDGVAVRADRLRGIYRGYGFANRDTLHFIYDRGMARLEESQLKLETGELRLSGTIGPGSNIVAEAHLRGLEMGPVSRLLPGGRQLAGQLTADVSVGGTTQSPQGWASLVWREGQVDQVNFQEMNTQLDYVDGLLTVEQFRAQREESQLRGQGTLPLDLTTGKLAAEMPWDLNLAGEGRSLGLLSVMIKDLERLDGPFTLQLHASGTPGRPRYDGFFNIAAGTLKLIPMGNAVKDITASAHLDGDYLVIDHIQGATPFRERNLFKRLWNRLFKSKKDGRFDIAGRMNLTDLAYDLSLKGERLYVNYLEEHVEAWLDANLQLRGQRRPRLGGQITLRRGLVTRPMSTPPRTAEGDGAPPLDLDLAVTIPKNCWLRNEAANIELRGQMKALQKDELLSVLGKLETVRGTYFFYGTDFQIERGLLTFDDLAEINPQLDVRAWTKVNKDVVYLDISGRMKTPNIKLSSESGYSEGDIISLLTLHQSPAGLDSVGAQQAVRSQAMGIFGDFLQQELDRKVGGFLGVDKFKIAPDPAARLDLSRAQLTVGAYISSRVYVEYSRRLSMESGEQVGVEYSLSRNLSLQGKRDKLGLYRLGFSLKWDY